MIGDPPEPEAGIVRILAVGTGEPVAGPGGWGAVLRYGEHVRELSGLGLETTAELRTFTAVVEALERLTRPMHVRVWCGGEGIPRPSTGLLPETENVSVPNADLYRRLLASRIADHLPDFYHVVVHKNFANPEELDTISSVLLDLMDYLQETGQIGARTAKAIAGDLTEKIGEFTAVRRFVDALSEYTEDEAPDLDDLDAEHRVTDQYAGITKITKTSITFREQGSGGATIGPITLPPEICAMTEPDWQILLTAAHVEDRWILLQVINGDP